MVVLCLVSLLLCSCNFAGDVQDSEPEITGPTYDVTIEVNCAENLVFSKYDVKVYVDNNYLGKIDHGGSDFYDLKLAEGNHTVKFVSNDSSSIDGSTKIRVSGEGTYTFGISCTRNGINIDSLKEDLPCKHEMVEADCMNPRHCSICGYKEDDVLGDHIWNDATCTDPKTCSVCGKTDGEALGHQWVDGTCTSPKTCSVCGATDGDQFGHIVKSYKTTKKATCTEDGVESGVCSVCGETCERAIPKLEHTPGDWQITRKATALNSGERCKKCKVCGAIIQTEHYSLSPEEKQKEYKKRCNSFSYKELARDPDKYKYQLVKVQGEVIQVMEASSSEEYCVYRVAVKKESWGYSSSEVILVMYDGYGKTPRVLEDDIVVFYGVYDGLFSYETVLGGTLTVPKVTAEYVDIK